MPERVALVLQREAKIVSAGITVEAIMINGRQLTLSVFRQIPLFAGTLRHDGEGVYNEVTGKPCELWGWVNYFWKDDGADPYRGERHFVIETEKRLFRSPDRLPIRQRVTTRFFDATCKFAKFYFTEAYGNIKFSDNRPFVPHRWASPPFGGTGHYVDDREPIDEHERSYVAMIEDKLALPEEECRRRLTDHARHGACDLCYAAFENNAEKRAYVARFNEELPALLEALKAAPQLFIAV